MIAYDVYADNCLIQRVHYFGYMQMLVQRYTQKGHVVKVEKVEIK